MEKTLKVESMMCEKCVKRVKKALEAVDGVEEAQVDLASKSAVVMLSRDVDDAALIGAVTKIDHTAVMA